MLRLIANIIWFIFGGWASFLTWLLGGILLCITIIGIPFGLQAFKFARLSLAPFGKEVELNFGKHPIINILWAIFFGVANFMANVTSAIALAVTIIGIPLAFQALKFAILGFAPFGAEIKG